MIKTIGYLISAISVLCLGAVAWDGAKEKPMLLALLVAGMATSILGMALRWASFAREQQAKGKSPEQIEGNGGPRAAKRAAQTRISK